MADMDSLIVKHVAKRLKIMRKLKNLTLEELSLSVGVSRKQLQNYEHCTSAIPIKRLFKLAKILQVNMAYFFEGIEDTHLNFCNKDIELLYMFKQIKDKNIKDNIFEMLKELIK